MSDEQLREFFDPLGTSLHLLFALAKSWEIVADKQCGNDQVRASQLRDCAKQLRQRATWVKERFEIRDLIEAALDRVEAEGTPKREQFRLWVETQFQSGWGILLQNLRGIARGDVLPDFSTPPDTAGDF